MLDADSAYVNVALHGDGLTSLQFREAEGTATHEVQANVSAPKRLRLEKKGKYVLMYLASGEKLTFSGAAVPMTFQEPFYVGLGVCAHNDDVTEKAVFSNVELTNPFAASSGRRSSTALSKLRRWPRRIGAWSTSLPPGSRRPTG